LIFGDELRIEGAGPVARNHQIEFGRRRQDRLLRIAVAVIGFAVGGLGVKVIVELDMPRIPF
jgi:hypothetical protein